MYTLQPARKTNPLVTILAIIGGFAVIAVAFIFFGGLAVLGGASAPESYKVVYRVTTTECLDFGVTYSMPNGTAQKEITACMGQDTVDTFTGFSGDFVSLSAQNRGGSYNDVIFTCLIEVNGKNFAQVQSRGFANIASCNASLP